MMQAESANHAESTGDPQEKSARSYELEFAPNLEFTLVDRRKTGFSNGRKDSLLFGELFTKDWFS